MLLLLVTSASLVAFVSAATRGESINSNIQKALNYRANGAWNDGPELMAMYTGLFSTGSWSTPLSKPIVDTSGNPSSYGTNLHTILTLQSAPGYGIVVCCPLT
jgi:hypothetical protein